MASISDLKAQLAGNKDKYVNQLLQQALNAFDDVEVSFVGILKDDQKPPRTLDEESRVLDHAEFVLERIAVPQLKAIQDKPQSSVRRFYQPDSRALASATLFLWPPCHAFKR